MITLARTRYAVFNHTHLTELLAEREGVYLARSTVRSILLTGRDREPPAPPSTAAPVSSPVLPRKDPCLGDRGPWLTPTCRSCWRWIRLRRTTSTALHALFQEQEDTPGYFQLLRGIIQQRGIPLAVRRRRTDRHAVFQHQRPGPGEAAGVGAPTQLGRVLGELGVTPVFAHSPEAKGRVERANGTFQSLP